MQAVEHARHRHGGAVGVPHAVPGAPRAHADTSSVSERPWERGRPARSGPKAHRCVQAGKMPALPGPACRSAPGSAGVPPARGPKAHRCVQAARCPHSQVQRVGAPLGARASRPQWAEGPPVCSSGQDARAPRSSVSERPWERGRPARSGPKAHPCIRAGKPAPARGRRGMPALPGGAPPIASTCRGRRKMRIAGWPCVRLIVLRALV